LKKKALGVGAAFGAIEIVSFAKDAVDEYSHLQESINAVTVSYGDAADEVLALGDDSAEAFGLSESSVNDAAVAMAGFATKIDEADPPKAFENVLGRARDFASVMNVDVNEALGLFRSGLAGESEPLRKFGLDVSAATVEQVALKEGIIQVGEKMTESQKVQARYRTIMQQTEQMAGDFANTSDGLANSQRILTAKWKDAQAVLGETLAPLMVELLDTGENLIPVFGVLVDLFGGLVSSVEPGLDNLGDLVGYLGDLVAAGKDVAENETFKEMLWRNLGDAVGKASDPIGAAVDHLSKLPDVLGLVKEKTGPTAEEFLTLALHTQTVKDRLDTLSAQLLITDHSVANFWDKTKSAVKATDDFDKSLEELHDEARALADPVFAAERAIDKYDEAVRTAGANGRITQQEFEDVTEALLDMKAAEAGVGSENVVAFKDASVEVADALGIARDRAGEFVSGLSSFDPASIPSLESFTRRWETLAGQPLRIDLGGLAFASNAEIDEAVKRAIAGMKRNGTFFPD
jgi:hypothetical protein